MSLSALAEEQFNGVLPMSSRLRQLRFLMLPALTVVVFLLAAPVRAENEGQDDLDQAYDKKLAAKNLDDLAQVIDLCESALKKGLDASNAKSANSLLTGVLLERASLLTRAIVTQDIKNWPKVRAAALADLEKAVKVDPTLGTAQLMIARLQALPGGDHAAALKAAEAAFDLSKDNTEQKVSALVLRADLTDDPAKKLDLFTQAIKNRSAQRGSSSPTRAVLLRDRQVRRSCCRPGCGRQGRSRESGNSRDSRAGSVETETQR